MADLQVKMKVGLSADQCSRIGDEPGLAGKLGCCEGLCLCLLS